MPGTPRSPFPAAKCTFTPQAARLSVVHERIRNAMLGAWGGLVASRPWATLTICLILAAAAAVLTVLKLEFRPDRSELVDTDLAWNQRYSEYKARFPRWGDITVCIEGEAGDQRVDELARRIAGEIAKSDRVLSADAGFDARETGPRLLAAAPGPLFDEVMGNLTALRRIAAEENANGALAVTLGQLSQASPGSGESAPGFGGEADSGGSASSGGVLGDEDPLDRLIIFLAPFLESLEGGEGDFGFLRPDEPRWLPLMSEAGAGRLRFIQVHFDDQIGGIDRDSENVSWLRAMVLPLVEGASVAVEWGVTGIPAIEADETTQSIHDSTVATILAFVLITLMMLLVFRGVVVPLLVAGSLLVGMAWSFGWLVISVGHLQLLSVVFSVILLGLGVDFALHLVARLELVQDEHDSLPSAISRVFRGIGPGMLTGAATTAAAFGVTAFTDFKGMAEMGIIAGGGILLCLVAMLCCFPAALAATGRWKQIIRHRPGGETAHFAHGRLDFVDFHARGTLWGAALGIALLALPAVKVKYDPNVLNLQPPEIESVEWEKRIVEDDARSVWSALIRTQADKAPELADRFRALPSVGDVGAMGLLVSADREERAERIAEAREKAARTPIAGTAPGAGSLRQLLGPVALGLRARAAMETERTAIRLKEFADRVERALLAASRVSEDERERRWGKLNEAYVPAAAAAAVWIDEAFSPGSPGAEDLPQFLREQWTAGDDWLLRIYPTVDQRGRSILHPDRLGDFVEALRTVDGSVFGAPVQIYESSELIVREYVKAACYAVGAILLLLLLDFRSLSDALCAMSPVSVGFIGVFGLMGLLGVPLNFANIIVMPLIFGIGVDAGVHVVHRWRAEPHGRPAGLSGGTGRGITLTMLTTMIGFGCMLTAEHRGIRSLGFVMIAGLGVTLLACYLVLPAVLRLRTGHWSEASR